MKQAKYELSVNVLGRQFSDATIFMHDAIAGRVGLSGSDHKYLNLLVEKGPMPAGDLAKLTGLTTGAVTGLIDRLVKKKLAKRQFSKEDRRKVIIVAQYETVQKLLAPTYRLLQKKIAALVNSFSEPERAVIEKYLVSAIQIMDAVRTDLLQEVNKS